MVIRFEFTLGLDRAFVHIGLLLGELPESNDG